MSRALSRRHLLGLGGATVVGTALAGATLAGSAPLVQAPTDLVVYGATVGGLMAAIQASRMGRSTLVIEPGTHIGGLTTGGLGYTDIGAPDSIGGIAAEFYRRIGLRYGSTDGSKRFTFAPSAASAVLDEMITEAAVTVYTGAPLARVERTGNRITALVTEDGRAFRGRMFVDATYEGDLMAAAQVSWFVGREANAEFGETINGLQLRPKVPLETVIDPYIVPGKASSGLLHGVSAAPLAPLGSGDGLIQAYNFRMCLTQDEKRIPFAKPEGYDLATYELMWRFIEKGNVGPFFGHFPVGGGKTDSNNYGAYSSDFVGQNHAYPTASRSARESIVDAHRTYQQGLMWFLANDPRLPDTVRKESASWGLAADEFTATDGWPTQLYVREARRLRSDYVMTEHDAKGERAAPDSVGLASYSMDSHGVQRLVVDGEVRNEGDLMVAPPGPYPISLRSIVPREAECENLLVPVCLAATHAAYGSIRMEPVFMILGQSAATAAILAMQTNEAVQQVRYQALRDRLLTDGQVLTWPPVPDGDIVVDNAAYVGVTKTGNWTVASGVKGYFAADMLHDGGVGAGKATVRFTPTLAAAGRYTVYLRWSASANRASNTPVDIVHSGGTATHAVDQRTSGGEWVPLGTYAFTAGDAGSVLIRTKGADGYVIADAVRFAPA